MTRSDRFVFWFRASNLHEISWIQWNQIHFEHQSYLIISMSYIEIVKMFLPYHMVSSTAAGACAWEILKWLCEVPEVPEVSWMSLSRSVKQCHAVSRRCQRHWTAGTFASVSTVCQGMGVTSFWQFWSVLSAASSSAYSHFVQLLLPGFYYWQARNIGSFNKPMIAARISCAYSQPQNKGKAALTWNESWLVMGFHTCMQIYMYISLFEWLILINSD